MAFYTPFDKTPKMFFLYQREFLFWITEEYRS
jgi:hypothetical protein